MLLSDQKVNSFYDCLTLRNGKNGVVIVVNWRSCEWDIISFIFSPNALVALTIASFSILYFIAYVVC